MVAYRHYLIQIAKAGTSLAVGPHQLLLSISDSPTPFSHCSLSSTCSNSIWTSESTTEKYSSRNTDENLFQTYPNLENSESPVSFEELSTLRGFDIALFFSNTCSFFLVGSCPNVLDYSLQVAITAVIVICWHKR